MATSSLWTFHGKLLPGESFDSWLIRLAHGNAIDLRSFFQSLLPSNYVSLHSTLELPLTLALKNPQAIRHAITMLVNHAPSSPDAVTKSMFRSTGQLDLLGWSRKRDALKAFLQRSTEHRTGKKFKCNYATQFCPTCLQEDTVPYLRKEWSLNFVTLCPVHMTLLYDRCTVCCQPLHSEALDWRLNLYQCAVCSTDLRALPELHVHGFSKPSSIQTQLLKEIEMLLNESSGGLPLYRIVLERLEANYYDDIFLNRLKKAVTQEFGASHNLSSSFARASVQERYVATRLLAEQTLFG